jgi:hypothetical protein
MPSEQQEADGKFAWGLLIKLIAPTVFQLFANWVMKKIEPTYDEKALRKLAMNVTGAGIVRIGALFASKDIILAGVEPNAALGEPLDELRNDASGENYQGVHVALVEVDANGAPIGFRTVADGFSTGERFKLLGRVRVLAAEGKLSAYILVALPFFTAGAIFTVAPKFMEILWTDPAGLKMVFATIGMMVVGILVMWRIVKIRV